MIVLKQFSENQKDSFLEKAKKDLKFRAKRAKYRYKDSMDFYDNKEAVEENRKVYENWAKNSRRRSGSNDSRQTIYHKNGMGPETIKDPEKYAFRKEETRRLEDRDQRMAEKALKRYDKDTKHPHLASLRDSISSLGERTYSETKKNKQSQYEGRHTKEVRRKEDWKDITTHAGVSALPLAVIGKSFGGKKGALIGGAAGAVSGAAIPTISAISRRNHDKSHNKTNDSDPKKPQELRNSEKAAKAGLYGGAAAAAGYGVGSRLLTKTKDIAAREIINDIIEAPLKKEPIKDPKSLLNGKKPGIVRKIKEKVKEKVGNLTRTKPMPISPEDKVKFSQYVNTVIGNDPVGGVETIVEEVKKSKVGKKIIRRKRAKAALQGAAIYGIPAAILSGRAINKRKKLQKAYEQDLQEAKEEREKRYSMSDEEKQYNKEVKSRKTQKKGLNAINGLMAGTVAGGLALGNSVAKDDVEHKIKMKVLDKHDKHFKKYIKRKKAVSAELDKVGKEFDKKFEEKIKDLPEFHKFIERLGYNSDKFNWILNNETKANNILKKALEKEDSDTILAADRIYKKAKKKINKKTALIGAGVVIPSVTYGTIRRHKKDKALAAKDPNKK